RIECGSGACRQSCEQPRQDSFETALSQANGDDLMSKTEAVTERAQATAWRPMSTCPKKGLVILKAYFEGGHWPIIASYSHTQGGYVASILGQNEAMILGAEAWAEIPAYDTGIHARSVAA